MKNNMRTMENLEYSQIIKEIEVLSGNRFEKMQEIEKGKITLKIGKERIVCELGKRLNIAYNLEIGDSKNGFVQKVRKELKGFRFVKVFQYNKDRIIVFGFEKGEEKKELIFEMFGKGNAILIQDSKILSCYKREKWADREIKQKELYRFPKSNIVEKFVEILSNKYIVSCMMRLPLGKRYVKEILKRVGVNEQKLGEDLEEIELKNIQKEMEKIKKEIVHLGFYKDGEIVDYGLTEFEKYKGLDIRKFEKLSEVVDLYYFKGLGVIEEKESKKIKKLKRRLEEQEKTLEELQEKEKKYKEIGDKIYEKYNEIEEILKKEKKKRELEIEI